MIYVLLRTRPTARLDLNVNRSVAEGVIVYKSDVTLHVPVVQHARGHQTLFVKPSHPIRVLLDVVSVIQTMVVSIIVNWVIVVTMQMELVVVVLRNVVIMLVRVENFAVDRMMYVVQMETVVVRARYVVVQMNAVHRVRPSVKMVLVFRSILLVLLTRASATHVEYVIEVLVSLIRRSFVIHFARRSPNSHVQISTVLRAIRVRVGAKTAYVSARVVGSVSRFSRAVSSGTM